MSRKRKADDHGEPPEVLEKFRTSSFAMFSTYSFYLHPAALSKTRRTIFERQIMKHGGVLMKAIQAQDDANVKIIALIEDNLIEPEKLERIAEKLRENKVSNLSVIGTSWLSKCLETESIVDCHGYLLTSKKLDINSDKTHSAVQVSYVESYKSKFVCAQSSDQVTASSNLNKHITDELEKLATAYRSSNDTWRAFGYQKAISALKNHPVKVTSREQAAKIPNVGKKMADKIVEIIEDGSLQKVQEVCNNEKMKVMELFNRVWGVGPSTADKWFEKGLRTLDDLKTRGNLSKQQKVGLKHFEDFNERIGRDECTQILEIVRSSALSLQQGLEVVACGSYRRGKETCGDLDILITHPDDSCLEGLFEKLLSELHKLHVLTDDLSIQRDGRQRKYLGVCRLPIPDSKHRRLDIIVVPYAEKATALLYFTGSAHFNRSMRLLATKMGMSLSEHALVTNVIRGEGREKLNDGEVIETTTEESVFERLGLKYRPPNERDH